MNPYQLSYRILRSGNLEISTKNKTAIVTDYADDDIPSDQTLCEVFDFLTSNGLNWVTPEALGALTSAPILSDTPSKDNGDADPDGNYWYFPDYALRSPIEVLIETGVVIFHKID